MGRFVLILAASLLAVGCSLDLGDAPFLCNQGGKPLCPDGYECRGTSCVLEGVCNSAVPCAAGFQCENNQCVVASVVVPDAGGPVTCGNGACDNGENCSTCQADCGQCPAGCGNGVCDNGENCSTCQDDCGQCPTTCGNSLCETGENCSTCQADCGQCPSSCGNNVCEAGETCSGCEADCGKCVVCGDSVCDATETATSCPADCATPDCVGTETQCSDSATLQYCENGAWKTTGCEAFCSAAGNTTSLGCSYSTTTSKYGCDCGTASTANGSFGELCTDPSACATGYDCMALSANATMGFCSKGCNTFLNCMGGPSGTTAECILDAMGTKTCVFTCDFGDPCPAGMSCTFIGMYNICQP